MADSEMQYLHEQLTTSQSKYTYFLLAAVASAIALALNRTTGRSLAIEHLPLGIAVLCWGVSFFFGCQYIDYLNATLSANAAIFRIELGQEPKIGNHS